MDDETRARVRADADDKARRAGGIGAEALARLRTIIHAHQPTRASHPEPRESTTGDGRAPGGS